MFTVVVAKSNAVANGGNAVVLPEGAGGFQPEPVYVTGTG